MLSSTRLMALFVIVMALFNAGLVQGQTNPNATAVIVTYNDAGCSPAHYTTFIASMPTNGNCFSAGGASISVTCANGNASYTAYGDGSCNVPAISGSGVGDGRTCIEATGMGGLAKSSAYINCNSPGATNGASSSSVASALMIALAVLVAVMASA